MKKMLVAVVLLLSLVLVGCNPMEYLKVQGELDSYIDEVSELNYQQEDLFVAYENKFVYQEDNDVALSYLKNEFMPQFENYMNNSESLDLENEEVIALHSIYIESVELNHQIIQEIITAMEQRDMNLLENAENRWIQYDNLLTKHETETQRLAQKYGIDLEWIE